MMMLWMPSLKKLKKKAKRKLKKTNNNSPISL
jgi:hypothetical protein